MKWFKKLIMPPPPPNNIPIQSQATLSSDFKVTNTAQTTNTWLESFNYDYEFLLRYARLLSLLPTNTKKFPPVRSILDLGCGMQYLKEVIKHDFKFKNAKYLGVDLYAHKSDTLLCDFNQKEFPKLTKDYDLIVCAGLFEYIVDLEFLIERICELEPHYILCSYNFLDFTQKHNPIWVKLHTQEELFSFFFKRNYKLLTYESDESKETLITGYFLFYKNL